MPFGNQHNYNYKGKYGSDQRRNHDNHLQINLSLKVPLKRPSSRLSQIESNNSTICNFNLASKRLSSKQSKNLNTYHSESLFTKEQLNDIIHKRKGKL